MTNIGIKPKPKDFRERYVLFEDTVVLHDRPAKKRAPLTEAAWKLFLKYMGLKAFWWATTRFHCPIDVAGKQFLDVAKTRANEYYDMLVELEQLGGDAPLYWFHEEALKGMEKGTIARGRKTVGSHRADSFFLALADGDAIVEHVRRTIGARRRVDVTELEDEFPSRIEREILGYMVNSNLLWRKGGA